MTRRRLLGATAAAAVAVLAERLAPRVAHANLAPEPMRSALPGARAHGRGLLRWWGFRVYEATLWTGVTFEAERWTSQPFALEIRYARAFSGPALADSSAGEIDKLGIGSEVSRREWAEAMRALFPPVDAGDRLVALHRPGRPTTFWLNERRLGEVADPAFGPAFFAIWLDPRTPAPALREALLRGADGARATSAETR